MSPTTAITAAFDRGRACALLTQALGAVCWGAFFSVAPFAEVLVFGCIVWGPLLIWREVVRSKRHGFLLGFIVRSAVVVVVVLLAAKAPLKYEDSVVVGPFPSGPTTLKAVGEQVRIIRVSESSSSRVVVLPQTTLSLRELLDEIEAQTGLRSFTGRCGNMNTILFGAPPIGLVHL